jgi:hypothetical protein
VGSRLRYNYTVIGQTVNLGSRFEACNKIYGTRILTGEETATLCGPDVVLRELDLVRVPGIVGSAAPVRLFEVMGERGKIPEDRERLRNQFEQALALYRQREFALALRTFEDLANSGDPVSQVYVSRCAEFEHSPPKGELVYEIQTK